MQTLRTWDLIWSRRNQAQVLSRTWFDCISWSMSRQLDCISIQFSPIEKQGCTGLNAKLPPRGFIRWGSIKMRMPVGPAASIIWRTIRIRWSSRVRVSAATITKFPNVPFIIVLGALCEKWEVKACTRKIDILFIIICSAVNLVWEHN